jgi:hypothetical protein
VLKYNFGFDRKKSNKELVKKGTKGSPSMNASNIPSFIIINDLIGDNDFFSEAFENRPIKIIMVAISLISSIVLVRDIVYGNPFKS